LRYAFVLDKHQQPLMPCHPARARQLLSQGKAAVFRLHPFTIILLERDSGECSGLDLKYDPGSKTTGVVLTVDRKKTGPTVLWAAELHHRGQAIMENLRARLAIRRGRRHRKTRYRAPRFLNRCRATGKLAPSLQSRVDNVNNLTLKLRRIAPIHRIWLERVKFDTQKLQSPEVHGIEYQQGTLFGYELREYLLEKWQRKCAYCDVTQVPLEIDHMVPRAKGGSDRVSNLTLACRSCNQKKGAQILDFFLAKEPARLKKLKSTAQAPLRDAAAVNTTRKALQNCLSALPIPVLTATGAETKYNRCQQGYPKAHWIDAACVGSQGYSVFLPPQIRPLQIQAMGRGSRQMCRVNKAGFPRTSAKSAKRVQGFQTGDWVVAMVPTGKKAGMHRGRVAVRATGNFNIKTSLGVIQGVSARYCQVQHRLDGYYYQYTAIDALPPPAEAGGLRARSYERGELAGFAGLRRSTSSATEAAGGMRSLSGFESCMAFEYPGNTGLSKRLSSRSAIGCG